MAGCGVGAVLGRVIAVPGPTTFWEIAAQPAATVFAGIGAISAGLFAYGNGERSRAQEARHHQDARIAERESGLRDRYTTAATQLSDDHSAVREAGVFAVAALADDWLRFGLLTGQAELAQSELQVCVELLCSYLRANRRIEAEEHGASTAPAYRSVGYPSNNSTRPVISEERAVRNSIAGVLRDRGRRWSAHPLVSSELPIDLAFADLTGCRLDSANLGRAMLVGVNFTAASLEVARLSVADLTHANLSGAELTNAKLDNSEMGHANLSDADLSRATLIGAFMCEANLTGADLRHADLTAADLAGANLTGADLTNATFGDTDLCGANLTDATLGDIDLDDIRYDSTTIWPIGFAPTSPSESADDGATEPAI